MFARALAKHPVGAVRELRGVRRRAARGARCRRRPDPGDPRRRGARRSDAAHPAAPWLVPVLAAAPACRHRCRAAVALSGGDSAKKRAAAAEGERLGEDGDAARHDRRHDGTRGGAAADDRAATARPRRRGRAAYALNNQAWELMKQRRLRSALPLLEKAVQQLQGRTDLSTAYANYNLGVTLISLGRCSEAMPYLEASRQIQPSRHEVEGRAQAGAQCSG